MSEEGGQWGGGAGCHMRVLNCLLLQVDPEPSIRANTTVLLGNIASLLGQATCKRILLNAFTRALRDVFPASRTAALKALMATSGYHSAQDVAARVVPAISPLMLDSVGDVRATACKVSTAQRAPLLK
jgi:SCY1-like protein 1